MTPDDVLYPADVAAKLKLDEATVTRGRKLWMTATLRHFKGGERERCRRGKTSDDIATRPARPAPDAATPPGPGR